MSTKGTVGSEFLSTHDLKIVCSKCSVKQNEITYTVKPVSHLCARDLLISKAKGGGSWRPVSRRPAFPNPNRYEVCFYFKEGSGCMKHKNRCTFARSSEEAAVWNFQKCKGLDNLTFLNLIALNEKGSAQQNAPQMDKIRSLDDLFMIFDLKAVCSLCSTKVKEITYTIQRYTVCQQCSGDLLLAKVKGSNHWRPVSPRPSVGNFGTNVHYQVCMFFEEGSGCTKDGQTCTFARTFEEATVWNFLKDNTIDYAKLIRLVTESKSNSMQPENIAENIVKEFPGEFIELCRDCFLGSPQKVTVKRWNDTCSADAAHTWEPVLVHHLSESHGKEIYNQVRPLPSDCKFEYCSHVKQGKPCWHNSTECHAAHSDVEMDVWKAESSGLLIRPELLQLSQKRQTGPRRLAIYCKVCLLTLFSHESFSKHCASLEHARTLSEDTTAKWVGRPPPHNRRAELRLCERPRTCEYGNSCLKAHSDGELQEWLMRAREEQEIRRNIEEQGLMAYAERLLEEYKTSINEVHIISEQVDDVSVTCDEELFVECGQTDARLQWNLHVNTERQLVHVALLKQEPGASFCFLIPGEITAEPCTYSSGEPFQNTDVTYDIAVSFTSTVPGLYEQWLVMDFDMRPVLLRKLKVRVGPPSSVDIEEPTGNGATSSQSLERWHRGNRVIIPCLNRTEEQEELLKEYKPPQMSFLYKPANDSQTPLTPENYKERMHNFLYSEEQAEDQVVSRLSIRGEITTSTTLQSERFGFKQAPRGELFCAVSVPCNLTPDTPEGLVLRRSIQSGLIAPVSSEDRNGKVYEASILKDTTSENKMHLQLSKRCCSELTLKSNDTHQMEVQFQMDRLLFCKMHKAVDLLPDTKRVLPDFKDCGVPVNDARYHELNAKQQSAIDFIVGDSGVGEDVAPLLIYGPFGTGKTFTLATAAKELTKKPENRVLICTYTNSSADLYVKDYFHSFISNGHRGIRPLRIKANKHGSSLQATDQITLRYCLLSEDGQNFLPPTKADLTSKNIVIATTSMARRFHDLKLSSGYFTHILIDEASQMLECEALIPLALAGPNTRVVLAGDHMQMGPKLFSVEDHQRSNHTLLNRMFHYYQGQDGDAAKKSRIIFNENYRSTKEIVEFVSTHFYVGKNDAIKAVGDIPGGPNGHSLKFHHVRGECHLDTVSMSWYNNKEVDKVVEVVQDVVQHWPSTWGTKDLSSVCVLSEGCQVRQIRTALGRRQIRQIKVENIANVQGKQFRAVIIAAVQTRESLKSVDLLGLELFNDARVLNTAMTRAKSQVVVVGDAAALCCFGKCSRIWKNYIDHCISNGSAEPSHLTKDFFEKDIEEISRFHRPEHSDMQIDAILEQLNDEYEQETECSSNEGSSEFECSDQQMTYITTDVDKDNLLELCKRQPNMFKQGQLVMESHIMGYVIPFDSPTRHIHLKGRDSLGKSFNGDEVVVQMSSSKGISQSKIIGVTKKADSARVFVCMLEDEDYCRPRHNSAEQYPRRMMIPVVKNAPKICILINRKKLCFISVWKHVQGQWTVVEEKRLDENLKHNHVFLVQVIAWKEGCFFPLGNIINILPIGTSVENGLRILNEEFKVALTTNDSNERFSWTDNVESQRKDLRKMLTFTVDPSGAKALDDAISLSNIGDQYEVGIHIADVATFVRPGDQLDQDAKRCGATYHCKGKEPTHMFPPHLSTKDWSLLPCQDRKVVSLMLKVEKETHKVIGEPTFQLSLINSDRGLSYEEAESIICERSGKEPKFDTVEDCVAVAYCFAKAHRKARLLDWAYVQTDDHRLPGKRKAHLMIEELNVLFNSSVSDVLISTQETMHCTPLRCQAAPDRDKLKELKENYGELIPLSFQARHRVDHNKQVPNGKSFRVLTKVWNDIQSAVKDTDTDKLVDLIAADDIHPQLLPLIFQYKKCLSKAYVIRSNSSPKAEIGHYSLKVKSYTQASSPIRRYIDIVLHRLLRTVICDTPVQYSQREIDILCPEFEQTAKTAKEYEQRAEMIYFAVNVKKQNASKLAFIVCADQEKDSFRVSFPFDKNIFQDSLPVMYRDLQLEDQPLYDREENCMILTWKRRIYSCRTAQIHQEVKRPQNSGLCTELPLKTWKAIVDAIDKENWKEASSLIMTADTTKQLAKQKQQMLPETGEVLQVETAACTAEEEHYVDLEIRLKPGDTLQIQLTSEIKRAYMTPTVQLVSFNPKFEVCVDHAHSPITCFSKCANYPSRAFYNDTNEYVQVWKPMCEMESAATAVDESDGIVIEDLVVNFERDREHKLKGSFNLSLSWIKKWAIECNLAQCLLCIRKRGLKLTSTLDSSEAVDPSSFTWVAHGVTYKVDEVKSGTEKVNKVDFYVNHLPMDTIPDCVFQRNVTFTVELIPKLLPDIRKENAIVNIVSACHLVQRIALGKHIPKDAVQCSVPRWQLIKKEAPEGLPKLNKSQYDAVEKALDNNFTLIQGPPGTGKTVVGVYIVYWFLELNSKSNRKFTDRKDKDKKEVILYCGPSNKSVDVVAEYLLKFGNNLKPLRVYSQQVEMLDYPYPGCGLQFSHTSRQERSKDELRSITMHHRMRQEQNPSSAEIKAFDERIQLALEGKAKELTDEEVLHYKSLLREARKYELERHDIVLCTCTVSSSPTLTKTISARQILIDECAMATEPQALIPLVCNKPEKIVLLGDHKQLRPIVKNDRVRKLGMSKSLFERYFTIFKTRTVMLNIQYRMHVNICKFPSTEYYDGLLRTEVQCRDSLLLDNNKPKTIVFGDIKGEEISLVVSTAKGNENSKANFAERDIVVNLAKKLVENGKIEPQSIVVLSPYNAQVSEIKASLQDIRGITVTTITKSQGSEWRYVIISTVRSLPSEEIEKEPDRAWMSKHVGFVGDANQINVGITRAKEGLCIIGNQELLNCSPAWKHLLNHYKANSSVTKAGNIAVRRVAR